MRQAASVDPEEIGRRYLAKIVQLEIALPPPVPADMQRVIREYGPSLRHVLPDPVIARSSVRQRLRHPSLSGVTSVVERLRWWPRLACFGFAVIYGAFTPGWWENEGDDAVSVIWGLMFFPAV